MSEPVIVITDEDSTFSYALYDYNLKIEGYLREAFLGFYNVSASCHLTVKTCQIISDYWLFAFGMNWKRRLYLSHLSHLEGHGFDFRWEDSDFF